jgi:hypothetical protein
MMNTHISLLFDLGASCESTDIARDKNQMLGEAAWAEHVRKTARKSSGPRRGTRPLRDVADIPLPAPGRPDKA